MAAKDWMRLIGLSLLWGGSFFFVAVARPGLPVVSIVWARVAIAAGLLAVVLALTRGAWPKGRVVWGALIVMAVLNNVVPFSLIVLAQGQISGGMASILNATTPLWAVVMVHLFTADEKITAAKAAGLALGFAGVVVMMGGALAQDVWASAACLGAAFSYGLAGVWGRRFKRLGVAPLTTAFGQVTCSTVILLPVWLWLDAPWRLPLPDAPVIGAVLGLAALSTALAYLIFFRLLDSAGATNLSLVTFVIPVSATLLGVVVLSEPLAARQMAGFALIACGLAAIDGRVLLWR